MKDENAWTLYCEELQLWMKKEISTMREILATLHLENDAGNEGLRSQLFKERSILLEKLQVLKVEKEKIIKTLALLAQCSEEELFAQAEKIDAETLILRDQIAALKEKINHENETSHPQRMNISPSNKPKKNGLTTIDSWDTQKPQD